MGPATLASGTCPPTRRVLRPGVEKSTPFSGGRYQDDQPYHHLPFPLPCVPPPSPSRLFFVAPSRSASEPRPPRTLAFRREKFRSSAAFRRDGAALAVKNHPFALLTRFLPLPPGTSYTYVNLFVRWSSAGVSFSSFSRPSFRAWPILNVRITVNRMRTTCVRVVRVSGRKCAPAEFV